MFLIRFNSDLKHYYECLECNYNDKFANIIGISSFPNILEGGFSVFEYNNIEGTEVSLIANLTDYSLLWERNENTLVFSNDKQTYKTYFMYDENNFINGEVTTIETITENAILEDEGIGREHEEYPHIELLDEDGFYLYKVVNGEKVNTTPSEKAEWIREKTAKELAEAKEDKINEISDACQTAIVNGVDVNNSHYSYTIEDQNNIYNSMNLAIQTNLDIPYHADGENCRLFTKEEIIEIYIANELNVTSQITYNNQMKQYINTLQAVEEIKAIEYGTPLTGKYLETYNTIMAQAEEVIRHITNIE